METNIRFKKSLGQEVYKELIRQNMSISKFADLIGCSRPNVYSILSRESVDTQLLNRISRALHVNFFKLLSDQFEEEKNVSYFNIG